MSVKHALLKECTIVNYVSDKIRNMFTLMFLFVELFLHINSSVYIPTVQSRHQSIILRKNAGFSTSIVSTDRDEF